MDNTYRTTCPRWVNISPLLKNNAKWLVDDLARLENNTVVDSVAYCCTLVPEGEPAFDKAAIYAKRFHDIKDEVAAVSPIRQGFLFQATMGHGWKPNSETSWQKVVRDNGNEMYKFCPLGKDFLDYIAKASRTLAAENPDFFMVDDDTRLITGVNGCYCPLHLAEFARRTGKQRTREEIIADCQADPALAAEWDRLRADSIAGLMEVIRAQFPKTTPGMFCCCAADAHHAARMARILAAPGQRPSVRLNNAWYCNHFMLDMPAKLSKTAREIADIGGGIDILDEADTCPQNRYSTSAVRMIDHIVMTSFEGCDGAKLWITRLGNFHETKSGEYYRELMARQKGYIETVSALKLNREGIVIPLPAKRPLDQPIYNAAKDWGTAFFGYMGIPYRYGQPRAGEIVALSGCDIGFFSDAEIRELLLGKVILDGEAAVKLTERGFGQAIGVEAKLWTGLTISAEDFGDERLNGSILNAADLTAADKNAEELSRYLHAESGLSDKITRIAPGSIRFKNKLGGTVVTIAADLAPCPDNLTAYWYFNETRKKQIIKILDEFDYKLSNLPVFLGDEPAVCLCGTDHEGKSIIVLDNIGMDTIEHPEFRFGDITPAKLERLADDGTWDSVEINGNSNSCRIMSPVESFRPAIFRY